MSKGSSLALAVFCTGFIKTLNRVFSLRVDDFFTDHGVVADEYLAFSGSTDKVCIRFGKGVDLPAELADQKSIFSFKDQAKFLIFFQHAFNVAVHCVDNRTSQFNRTVHNIAVIGCVTFCQSIIYILGAVFIENLLLTVGIKQRPCKGEQKHHDQQTRAEHGKSVAHKALEHTSAR